MIDYIDKIKNLPTLWGCACLFSFVTLLNGVPTILNVSGITDINLEATLIFTNTFFILGLFFVGGYGVISVSHKLYKLFKEKGIDGSLIVEYYLADAFLILLHAGILFGCSYVWSKGFNFFYISISLLTSGNIIWLGLKLKQLLNAERLLRSVNEKAIVIIYPCFNPIINWMVLNGVFLLISTFIFSNEIIFSTHLSLDVMWLSILAIRSILDLYLGRDYYKMVLTGEFNLNN